MEEAVVRIILDSAGGRSAPGQPTPTKPSTALSPQLPTPAQLTPPAPPKSSPIPVVAVDPPKPLPPPAAPPQPPQPPQPDVELKSKSDKPTAPPKSEPIPVKPVDPPKPLPPPAASVEMYGLSNPLSVEKPVPPPTQSAPPAVPRDWIKDLTEGIAGANRHVLIEGQSGSGKSLLTREVAQQRIERGEEVHVADPGHDPAQWKGAKSVFGADTAGTELADFLKDTLAGRKKQKEDAAKLGQMMTQNDFKPMTIVLSDFKKLLQDYPKLANEVNAVLQEGRKFNIAILAEAASMSGIKGVASMRPNFAQKVELSSVRGPSGLERKAEVDVGGQRDKFDTPDLSSTRDTFDPSIVRVPAPPAPPEVEEPFDPVAIARARVKKEEERAAVDAEYKKLKPPEPPKPRGALDTLIKTVEPMRGAVGGMFGGMAGISLDTTAAMRKQASQTSDEDGGAGKATAALGGVALAGAAVVKTFSLLDGEVQKSISRYAEYSPDIAQAQAQADMKTILNDMRRAQEHGPEIARYIEAQAELQNKWEDAKMKFMEAVMPIMEELMKVVEIFIPLVEVAANLLPLIEVFIAKAHPVLGAILIIAQIASWFRSREDTTNDDFFNFDPFTILTGGIGGAATPGGPQANTIFGGV